MRIALAQMNSTLGDFAGNRSKILSFARQALELGAELLIFPEHAMFGYPPNDLLERPSIVENQIRELKLLESETPRGISLLVGCVTQISKDELRRQKRQDSLANKVLRNSAALIERGKPTRYFHKELLPNYDIFDEGRHLLPGSLAKGRIKFRSREGMVNIQVSICEDMWAWGDPLNPMKKLPRTGTDLVINMSASPFTKSKFKGRLAVIRETAAHFRAPVVFVNMVGGQDEILFDGRSLVADKSGKIVLQLPSFVEKLSIFDVDRMKPHETSAAEKISDIEILRRALVIGIRDFAFKTGLTRCHFGLSGGIDSAVVACLAVDAMGADAVTAVTLPGPFNESKSRTLAEALAKNLAIRCLNMDVDGPYRALLKSFEAGAGVKDFGLVNENLQARVRGVLLMAISNRESSLLISTGNKSEYATGYTTLYGDQCGGLAPLGDLLKREVYALASHYNIERDVIPKEIIERAPSAELRPNQKDQDSLPPYDELDDAVVRVIEKRMPAKNETEKFVLVASLKSEFKRWQAPPILKVSDHAFGRGRRIPIAQRAKS
jgi:NAD+ synthase (glutamine-hydrolysing)